jgi:hypothetical protein
VIYRTSRIACSWFLILGGAFLLLLPGFQYVAGIVESGFGNDVLTFRDGGAFYACLAVEAIIGAYVLGKGLRNLLVR